jgi:hypothetical protein
MLYMIRSSPATRRVRSVLGILGIFVVPAVKIEPGISKDGAHGGLFRALEGRQLSIVESDDEDEAYELLDESATPVELSALKSCLIDFELTDRGSFQLGHFGEVMQDEILERGYPVCRRY